MLFKGLIFAIADVHIYDNKQQNDSKGDYPFQVARQTHQESVIDSNIVVCMYTDSIFCVQGNAAAKSCYFTMQTRQMNFKIIETFDNYIDANLTLSRLEEAGVNCWLQDENTATINPVLANAIGGIKLVVLEEDVPKATELLNALKEIKRKSFACPHCGSHNIEYITTNRKAGNIISSVLFWMLGNYAIGVQQVWHCFDCNEEFKEPVMLNKEELNATD